MRFAALACLLLFGCASTPVRVAVQYQNVIGDIDSASLEPLAKRIAQAPPGNFSLYFVSPGGSVFDGLDFIRVMEMAQSRGVRFVCTADLAASMGAVIFSVCDERIAMPRAMFLIHSASAGARGNSRDMREHASTLEAISDALYRQIARVLNIPFEELKKRANGNDYWFDSGVALEIGMVQRVAS